VFFGFAPVATAGPPLQLTEENLTAGAKVYRDYRVVCHGKPG
jgi:hypothetical protein